MATIRSVFAPGQTFNVLDPNAWVGGIVPGPNDIAQIGENGDYRTRINMASPYNIYDSWEDIDKNDGPAILPWTGSDVTIRVDDNNTNYNNEYEFPDTDGSFLIYMISTPPYEFPIKINYVSKSLDNDDYFYSCSVDTSYGGKWVYKTDSNLYNHNITPEGFFSESFGFIHDNLYVYPLETKFELTGSDIWHVGQIETLERCHLTIKDNAHLKLDGSTVNPNAIYNYQDSYRNVVRILDDVTVEFTGSVQRNNAGIYNWNRDGYQRWQISGSDKCPVTTLSQSTSIGDSTLILTNSSSFGVGDIISIDYSHYDVYATFPIFSGSKGSPTLYSRYDINYTSQSILNQRHHHSYIDHDFKDIEVVQIISQSGNESTIAQLYGKEGKIQADLGTYTYTQFVQTFGGSPSNFSGTKRVVLIESGHKNFTKGDKLIISKSLVTEILHTDTYTTNSIVHDFRDSATIEETFYMPEYRLTGSFLAPNESLYHNTSKGSNVGGNRYNEYFDLNNNIMISERTSSLNSEVTRSAHLKSSNSHIYSVNNPYTYWSALIQNTYDFHEGEIEVEYGMHYFREDDTVTHNLMGDQTRFNITLGQARHGSGIGLPLNQYGSSIENQYSFGRYQDNVYFGAQDPGQGNYNKTYNFPPNTGSLRYPTDRYFEKVKIERKKGQTSCYYNDELYHTINGNYDVGPISIYGHRYLTIYKISMSRYYQLVLLDTNESVNKHDEVLEGVYLKHPHSSGQRIRTNATKIKDALGHKNILHDYIDNPETNIRPYFHGQTTTQNTGGNYYNYYRNLSNSDDGGAVLQGYTNYGATPNYAKTGTGYYAVWDLQTEVSMSAFSFVWLTARNYDYMEMAGEDIQIDVSNDINASDPWTTVYGPTPDPKLTSRMGQQRFYHFTSGSTSARFIKISLNGNSRETSNRISKIGLYNFYDEGGTNLGNSVELYNADTFEVGDKIYFVNYKNGQPNTTWQNDDGNGISNLDREKIVPNILGENLTHDDVHGGISVLYEIIAKDGNKITLDRTMASWPIEKDTIVYKWNQGGINFKGNFKNIYSLRVYNVDDYNNPYQLQGANFDHLWYFQWALGNRNQTTNSILQNSSFNVVKNITNYIGNNLLANNIIIGGSSFYIQPNEDTQKKAFRNLVSYNNIVAHSNAGHYLYSAASMRPYNNKIISLYNQVIKPRENASGITQYSGENDMGQRISSQTIRIQDNYFSGVGYNLYKFNTAFNLLHNQKETLQNVIIKDNYVGTGYFDHYTSKDMGGFRERSFGALLNNPNIDKQAFPVSYHLFTNNYQFRWVGFKGQFGKGRGDDHEIPYVLHDYVKKQNYAQWGTGEQSHMRLYHSPTSINKYRLIRNDGYTNSYYNQSARYKGLYNSYRCQFEVLSTQNIQIQLDFIYRLIGVGSVFATNRSWGTQYNNWWVEDAWKPRIVFLNDKRSIIDSVMLGYDLNNDLTFSYDKTFNLPPGTYSFGLTINSDTQHIDKFSEIFEHGPISFQILSDDISNTIPLLNNWDAYKILDGKNVYSKEFTHKRGSGINALIRPSGNPSNLKFRRLKL